VIAFAGPKEIASSLLQSFFQFPQVTGHDQSVLRDGDTGNLLRHDVDGDFREIAYDTVELYKIRNGGGDLRFQNFDGFGFDTQAINIA
jgi:hypothetical protein